MLVGGRLQKQQREERTMSFEDKTRILCIFYVQ